PCLSLVHHLPHVRCLPSFPTRRSSDLPRPLVTTFTVGADAPAVMAAGARGYTDAGALKLKLTDDGLNAERVRAVRAACPEAWLRSEEHTSELQSRFDLVCRLLLEKKKK